MGQEVREFLSKTIFGRQRQAKVIQCGRQVKIASLWAVLSIRIHFILGPWKLFDSRLMFTWTFLLELYTPEGLHLLENFLLPFLVLPRPTKGKKRRKATTTTRRIGALFLSFFTIKLFPGTAWIKKKKDTKRKKKKRHSSWFWFFSNYRPLLWLHSAALLLSRDSPIIIHSNVVFLFFSERNMKFQVRRMNRNSALILLSPSKKIKPTPPFFCLIRANDIQRLVSSYPLQISKVKSFFHPKKKKRKSKQPNIRQPSKAPVDPWL